MFEQLPLQDRALMDSMLQLNAMEQLGQRLYRNQPSWILQPVRSEEERAQVTALMDLYGIEHTTLSGSIQPEALMSSPVIQEQNSIRNSTDIAVDRHPRFLGNAPHTHDFFELNYVCRGTATQIFRETRMELQQGDLLVICPGVCHDVLSLQAENIMLTIRVRRSTFSRTFFGLFTEGDVFYEYFQNILYRNQSEAWLYFRTGEDLDILHLCLSMYRESITPREYSRKYLNLLMSEIFLRLLRDHCGHLQTGPGGTKESAPVALMLQYISANCRDVTLQAVAEKFHYNTSYLSRLLKESMGKTFVELRSELRLDQARKLLETTDCSPAEAAELVGYQNMSHFYRAFKARTGLSPRECREQRENQ